MDYVAVCQGLACQLVSTLDGQHHQQAKPAKDSPPVFPRPVPANDIAPPLALAGRCGLAHGFNSLNCSDQKIGVRSCGKPRAEPVRLGWKPMQRLHTQRMSGAIEPYIKISANKNSIYLYAILILSDINIK
jgi:hypothetical protein